MVETALPAPAIPIPQVPQAPQDPQAPQTLQAPQKPAQQVQNIPQLNWSHLKPEFSGKPEEDADSHLPRMTGWMHIKFKKV